MNFRERKLQELNLMRSWIGEAPLAAVPADMNIYAEKNRLIRLVAAQEYSQHAVMLTNFKQEQIQLLGEAFSVNYSRQGGTFNTKTQFPLFYPKIDPSLKGISGTGYFLKSGQSANYTALMFLMSLPEAVTFDFPARKIYFETHSLFFYLEAMKSRKDSGLKGLFIDSGLMDLEKYNKELIEKHDIIIFDTTCFSSADSELLRIIKAIDESKRTAFLTRSHLKLDSLGVEYGSLGSVFIMNGEIFPMVLPSEVGLNDVTVDRLVMKMASLAGLHVQPHEVYPFLTDTTFLHLNELRVDALKENMGRVEKAIQSAIAHYGLPLSVERYEHRLYCKVRLDKNFEELWRAVFPRIKKALNVDVFHCDSFGYDLLGLCVFTNSEGNSFLRVTSYDCEIDQQALENLFHLVFGAYSQIEQ